MSNFNVALQPTLENEGGYVLHKVKGDNGGLTYGGISERANPNWKGWEAIKNSRWQEANFLVDALYREKYWNSIRGEDIERQEVANIIFDTAVNMGVRTTSKMVQLVINTTPDGIVGNQTIEALNDFIIDDKGARLFVSEFTLAKVARVALIVRKNSTQRKFLLGWINRYIGV